MAAIPQRNEREEKKSLLRQLGECAWFILASPGEMLIESIQAREWHTAGERFWIALLTVTLLVESVGIIGAGMLQWWGWFTTAIITYLILLIADVLILIFAGSGNIPNNETCP